MRCPECGGTQLSLSLSAENASEVADGLLSMHDVQGIIVVGCDECSATARVFRTNEELAGLVDADVWW